MARTASAVVVLWIGKQAKRVGLWSENGGVMADFFVKLISMGVCTGRVDVRVESR